MVPYIPWPDNIGTVAHILPMMCLIHGIEHRPAARWPTVDEEGGKSCVLVQ